VLRVLSIGLEANDFIILLNGIVLVISWKVLCHKSEIEAEISYIVNHILERRTNSSRLESVQLLLVTFPYIDCKERKFLTWPSALKQIVVWTGAEKVSNGANLLKVSNVRIERLICAILNRNLTKVIRVNRALWSIIPKTSGRLNVKREILMNVWSNSFIRAYIVNIDSEIKDRSF